MKPLALYLHVPFCRSKCAYCDFASYPGREDRMEDYVDALLGELRSWREALAEHEVRTVFIGGGTPSLLSGESLSRIMDGVRTCARVAADAEITMEANPGTLEAARLPRGGDQPPVAGRAVLRRRPAARAGAHPHRPGRRRGRGYGAGRGL